MPGGLRDGRATLAIAALTTLASLAVLATGSLADAAVGGGFIPLRFDHLLGSSQHAFPIPAWATPLTATLVHGGLAHLILNLVMLVFCGMATERALGAGGLAMLYVVGAYAGAAVHYVFDAGSPVPMIGASGAISAIVGAYALFYSRRRDGRVKGAAGEVLHVAWLAAAWIGIQLLIGVAGIGGVGSIAIGAHIGGFLAGLALARPLLRWRYRTA